MGEAKRKRERLGEWYGRSIVPGHPDHVAPPPGSEPPPERDEQTAVARIDGRNLGKRVPARTPRFLAMVMATALAESPRGPNDR